MEEKDSTTTQEREAISSCARPADSTPDSMHFPRTFYCATCGRRVVLKRAYTSRVYSGRCACNRILVIPLAHIQTYAQE